MAETTTVRVRVGDPAVIDLVADAIRREQCRYGIYAPETGQPVLVAWEHMNSRAKKMWRNTARAALAALPTEPEVAARVEGERRG
mgnify:CR=1 FL=1